MTFTVTVRREAPAKYLLTSHKGCEELNPKELLLLSVALCASHTLEYQLKLRRVVPKEMELTLKGELSTPTLRPESTFTAFDMNYNVACHAPEEQERVSEAINQTHETSCGLLQMLRRIAPVTHSVKIVTTH